ncbi:multidrug DMT transporter permease [Bradyrhizobium sacchari]|uniref:Drug/metabolite transporter (DMT)-like permease n=1 Tax=Bradyrhizobium sacchari TaxID=1399419 RepID=A0A560KK66_9BRAD|nr:EamA family transporter [Bradyrhizobium sacchari]OPZ00324.1 multidrug DMT transporter permease [Bradyrhizobium sacchari]TWB64726.1 drug/metabolite transporter (DMT)-like permease [Bradyrhizobium sacchari]TWB81050.1 drug/metabolite transporter (DMT)-like permease [Bradyrhizobium sacchari]
MRRRFLVIGAFAAIYLLWGSTYFAITLGLKSIQPFLLMALRSFCGGTVLLAMSGRQVADVSMRTWATACLCGLLFFVGCHGVLAFAQQSVPSGVAAIVLATIPFWILLIDTLFPGDQRPRPLALLALVPGFFGVGLVAWQNVEQAGISILPVVWLLLAALSWSAGTVLSRRMSSETSAILLSGMQLSIGGAVLFAISWLTGEVENFRPRDVSPISLAAVLWLIVAGSVIGFVAYNWLLENVPTSLVSTYTFVNPVIAVLLGTIVLGEPFSRMMLLGAGLVIISVIIIWRAEHAANRPTNEKDDRSMARLSPRKT